MPSADDIHCSVRGRGGSVCHTMPGSVAVGNFHGKSFFLPCLHPGLHFLTIGGGEGYCSFGARGSFLLKIGRRAHIVECNCLTSLRLAAEHIQQSIPFSFGFQRKPSFALPYRKNNHPLFRIVVRFAAVRFYVVSVTEKASITTASKAVNLNVLFIF